MAGSIVADVIGDGTRRYRARYRDTGGRQHEKRFKRRVDAQGWLDEQTSAIVTQTWTAPERGRVTVEAWAEQWIAAQIGLRTVDIGNPMLSMHSIREMACTTDAAMLERVFDAFFG